MILLVVLFLFYLAHRAVQGASLTNVTPEDLMFGGSFINISSLFRSFPINDKEIKALSKLLEFTGMSFGYFFSFQETPERSILFKEFAKNPELHETIFHYSKLKENPEWYGWFFSPERVAEYQGSLLVKRNRLKVDLSKMRQEMAESIILNQIKKTAPIFWLHGALKHASEAFVLDLFDHFDIADVTTEVLDIMIRRLRNSKTVFENLLRKLDDLKDSRDKVIYSVMVWSVCRPSRRFNESDEFNELIRETSRVDIPESFDLESALALLGPMHEGRTDKAFWGTYYTLALRAMDEESMGNDKSYIIKIAENIPEGVFDHVTMGHLIGWVWDLLVNPETKERLLAMTPRKFVSSFYLSLEEHRNYWTRTNCRIERSHRIVNRNFLQDFRRSVVDYRWSLGRFVLNYWYDDGTGSGLVPFSSKLFNKSMKLISSTPNLVPVKYSFEDLATIMLAWPFMIAEGKKQDLSSLFPQDSRLAEWEDIVPLLLLEENPLLVERTIEVLKCLLIYDYFTLWQLRELIDSSYDPAEDQ